MLYLGQGKIENKHKRKTDHVGTHEKIEQIFKEDVKMVNKHIKSAHHH